MGYQGLIELARRAGTTITCGTVHENDTVIAREGLHQDFDITYDIKQGRGEVIGVYAIAETREGNKLWRYMSIVECLDHGKRYSKAFTKPDSPWQTARIPMCLKTVIVQVCKYAPKSILAEWVEVETRGGMKLDTLTPSSALQDDDSPIYDVDATEPEPGKRTLDDIAQENAQDALQDAQPPAGKPTRSELNKMLLQARKAAKMTQEDIEQLASDNIEVAISELDDAGIICLIDLCNAKQ
jgi:recombinational DNA repair protein RecT